MYRMTIYALNTSHIGKPNFSLEESLVCVVKGIGCPRPPKFTGFKEPSAHGPHQTHYVKDFFGKVDHFYYIIKSQEPLSCIT